MIIALSRLHSITTGEIKKKSKKKKAQVSYLLTETHSQIDSSENLVFPNVLNQQSAINQQRRLRLILSSTHLYLLEAVVCLLLFV